MDAFDDSIPDSPSADAIKSVCDRADGFLLRNCEGPRASLNWQAGVLATEHRNYRGQGMSEPFERTVSLFHLLGYGQTPVEALKMAKENRNGSAR